MGNSNCCSSCHVTKDDIETRRFTSCNSQPIPDMLTLPPPLDHTTSELDFYLHHYSKGALSASLLAAEMDRKIEADFE